MSVWSCNEWDQKKSVIGIVKGAQHTVSMIPFTVLQIMLIHKRRI